MRVNLGKINLEYCLSGERNREAIVFVHGLGVNLNQFKNQHSFFQDTYKVISISLRGHGNTGFCAKSTESDFDLSKLKDDIIKLLNILGIEKVHYVGNSLGGNVGYELLKEDANRLLSFTTFGTTAQLTKSQITIKFVRLLYVLFSIETIANLASIAGMNKDSRKQIKDMVKETKKRTILNIIPHLVNFNYLEVIKKSSIPATIIRGEMDKEINRVIKSSINTWQEKDNFKLVELKGAGHFANLDRPKEFNNILRSFIEGI